MVRRHDDIKDKKDLKGKKRYKNRGRDYSDDDSSVDERGNIRGLIAYSDEDTGSSSWRQTSSSSGSDRRRYRRKMGYKKKDKVKAKTNMKTKSTHHKKHHSSSSEYEESERESEEYSPPPRRQAAIRAERRIRRELKYEKSTNSSSSDSATPARTPHKKMSPPKRRRLIIEDVSEAEEDDSDEDVIRHVEDDEEEEDEYYDSDEEDEDEYDSDDDDDDDEDEDEDDEYDDDDYASPGGDIQLVISDLGAALRQPPKPKKYKLNKEPENVRRFVKLVQTEVDPNEEDIDRDIGYFKGLTPRAQDRLLTKLQVKAEPPDSAIPLKFQILGKEVAPEVERVAMAKYQALQNIDPSSTEYYKTNQWIHGYTQLPLGVYKDLPVRLEDGAEKCQEFVGNVRKQMDTAIYGHDEAKLQILQFVSSWIANPTAAGNVLSIYGPPGVGKTTLVKEGVAKALGRPFHFITLGGATDASYLDGHSYTYEGSTWGRIVDVLIKSKCMNPVIYFDELDKVSDTPKGEEINNLLIHLTDGSQNQHFQDKYFTGIDLDLSRCLFIFSHNAHEKVNPILRDRMYNIQVDGFNTEQKLVIAEQYLVPAALTEVNLFEKISISKDVLTHIIREFTGEEKGVRELKRCIQTIISKLNLLRFYNDPARVPFAIKEFTLPFTVKRSHIEVLLKKKPGIDPSIAHLYI